MNKLMRSSLLPSPNPRHSFSTVFICPCSHLHAHCSACKPPFPAEAQRPPGAKNKAWRKEWERVWRSLAIPKRLPKDVRAARYAAQERPLQLLAQRRVIFVWFNAWQFTGTSRFAIKWAEKLLSSLAGQADMWER